VICPNCGAQNDAARKFCGDCGTKLARACRNCGFANGPTVRFCGECGERLDEAAGGASRPAGESDGARAGAPAIGGAAGSSAAGQAPTTERRIVSVLFADLVGFTARSDGSDPEQVREFLTRYFDAAREVVARYGGTIEKFIGDAVMAVWGTPVALEDDAERAVRAGLDLVEAVRQLGREAGDLDLELRAGILTGEAAVTVGATNQSMVAGDLVNTASRLQSVAPPGTVLVGEATHRAANLAILFEEAGDQVLRGKAAPVRAWRALRVVAERRGARRTEGLEAPFVGRDDELRLLKDVYHQTVRERRSRLISVTGQAGIGKSRLAWEFAKYLDGLVEAVNWHQGRSPSYGEGVTFWALGEMIRRRAKLVEGDDERTTRERIGATLVEYIPDEVERRWVEPALLFLLGAGDAPIGGRDELFAAWRTFFERVAVNAPTVLVFEDLHWADGGLLDFIDHLLDWSKTLPILVVTLARPELLDRRPGWGAGRRNFVALSLEPLAESAMRQLLAGLVPGLPESAARTILTRAGGVPLYAVETVRMLVAEGRLEVADGVYRPVGDLSALRVPESLHALVAARLDALDPADRSTLQDAAVLGQTFAIGALAALDGQPIVALEVRLRDLVRREVLTVDNDLRSPERGQFGFNQALIREVAYSTLTRRDRRTRHLAAARYFEGIGEDELVGALATHYLAAFEASPEGPEADAVAAQARVSLKAAAERAAALGSPQQAIAYLQQALTVTSDPVEQTELLERAGASASAAGRHEEGEAFLRQAIDQHRARGDRSSTARTMAALGASLLLSYRAHAALDLLEPATAEFADMPEDPAVVTFKGQLARTYFFLEDYRRSQAIAETVLEAAERLDLIPIIADTLVTRGMGHAQLGRVYEGVGALEAGLRLAEANGLFSTLIRARINIGGTLWFRDPRAAIEATRPGIDLARRLGRRTEESILMSNLGYAATRVGEWDSVLAELRELAAAELERSDRQVVLQALIPLLAYRGEPVHELLEDLETFTLGDSDAQNLADLRRVRAAVALSDGTFEVAYQQSMEAGTLSLVNGPAPMAYGARAATWAGDREHLREALDRHVATGQHGPALELERTTMRAAAAAMDGNEAEARSLYRDAFRGWRDIGCRFDFALTAIDAVTVPGGRSVEVATAAAEAREILVALGARPLVARLDELLAGNAAGRARSGHVVAGAGAAADESDSVVVGGQRTAPSRSRTGSTSA